MYILPLNNEVSKLSQQDISALKVIISKIVSYILSKSSIF